MRLLVTGANGFIGSHLCLDFHNKPETNLLDTGKGACRLPFHVEYVTADITSPEQAASLIHTFRPDWIIHAAAISSVDHCVGNPCQCYKVNVGGTTNILDAAEKVGSKILFFSSDFVFKGDKKRIWNLQSLFQ